MTDRQKEEKLVESLKEPAENHSVEISKLIDDTLKARHKVYIMTDWHLWKRKNKGKPECHKRKEFNEIIDSLKVITPDDLLIYMGDLVDGEFKDKEQLKNILLPMNFKKVLVIGNNDLYSNVFYRSCGFDYVVRSFVWKNIIFTHMPIKHNEYDMNVCGHLHGFATLWVPYNNHVEVGWCGGRFKPIELMDVIKAQQKYAKQVKECPEHFNEGYEYNISIPDNCFDMVMNMALVQVDDPYPDEED